ncbi:MAG: peptidoglycan bridge formation glycyltransferase FemA/FemB family protein [bacterium]
METKQVTEQNQWEEFVGQQNPSQFLQSWAWGEFQQSLGRHIYRLGVFNNGQMIAAVLCSSYQLPMKQSYLYVPRGPIMSNHQDDQLWQIIHESLIKQANEQSALAIRIEPPSEVNSKVLLNFKYQKTESMQPQFTRVLDLTKSLEELKKDMHHKTRYNIGLAERKGVIVREDSTEVGLKTFLELQKETAARDKIKPFPDSYFHKMFQALQPAGLLSTQIAEYQNQPLVTNLMIKYDDTASYSHGASANAHRNVMAPYLTQWSSIIQAKEQGYKYYDFRGIAPTDDPNHAWAGITRFKAGFGGRVVEHPGTFDFPIKKSWYQFYMMSRKLVGLVR